MIPSSKNRTFISKYLLLFLVVMGILFRSWQEYLLIDFPPDKRLQTVTALNFSDGNGISISYASEEDLSKTVYEKVGLWPPGFAVSLAGIMGVGFTFFEASFILEVIAVGLLFFSFYGILRLMKKELLSWIPPCFIIFQSFTISTYKVSFSNDLLALSFSVCAFYLILIISQGNKRWRLIILFGIISFLPSFYRFSFYPVSLILPVLLILYAYFIEQKLLAASLVVLLITGSLVGLQLLYQSTLPTGLSYLDEYHPGPFSVPYWDNLLMFKNLPLEMLTNEFLFKRSLYQVHPDLYLLISRGLFVGFVFLVFALIIRLVMDMKQKGRQFFLNQKNKFLTGGLIICLGVVGFLTLLSLRYPAETAHWMPTGKWTYVAETRYYNLVLIIFPLLFLFGFQDYLIKKRIKWIAVGLVAPFFIFSLFVSGYYILKYSGNSFKENATIYYHYHQEVEDYLAIKQSASGEESLVFGPAEDNGDLGIYASLLQIPLFRLKDIEASIKAKAPVCLLLCLSEAQGQETKDKIQRIVTKYGLRPVKEFPDLQVKLFQLCIP